MPISFADTHQSLSLGVVDCAITGPSSANSAGWPEVTTHQLPLGFQMALNGYAISLKAWNSLKPDQQAKLKAAFDGLTDEIWKYSEELFLDALNCNAGKDPCTTGKKFKLVNVPVTPADGELVRSAVSKVSLPVWAEVCDKSNPDCSKKWSATVGTGAGAEVSAAPATQAMGARSAPAPPPPPARRRIARRSFDHERPHRKRSRHRVRRHLPAAVGGGGGRDREPQGLQRLAAGRRRTGRLCAGGRLDDRVQPGADGAQPHPRRRLPREVPARAAGRAELAVDRLAGRAGALHRLGGVEGDRRYAPVRQHRADAVGDAADLAAERLVRGPGDLRAGGQRLCGARDAAAGERPHRRAEPRLPSEEREGRAEGRTRRPGAYARTSTKELNHERRTVRHRILR